MEEVYLIIGSVIFIVGLIYFLTRDPNRGMSSEEVRIQKQKNWNPKIYNSNGNYSTYNNANSTIKEMQKEEKEKKIKEYKNSQEYKQKELKEDLETLKWLTFFSLFKK